MSSKYGSSSNGEMTMYSALQAWLESCKIRADSKNKLILLRAALIGTILAAAGVCSALGFIILNQKETSIFENQYDSIALSALGSVVDNFDRMNLGLQEFAVTLSTLYPNSADWPFVCYKGFYKTAGYLSAISALDNIATVPIVKVNDVPAFEAYLDHWYDVNEPNIERYNVTGFGQTVIWVYDQYLNDVHDTLGITPFSPYQILAPILQILDSATLTSTTLGYNVHGDPRYYQSIDQVLDCVRMHTPDIASQACGVVSESTSMPFPTQTNPYPPATDMMSLLAHPVFPANNVSDLVGFAGGSMSWAALLKQAMPSFVNGLDCVVKSDTKTFTYTIVDGIPIFQGAGDSHDRRYSKYEISSILGAKAVRVSSTTTYTLSLYPRKSFEKQYKTMAPPIAAIALILVFLFCGFMFMMYDVMVVEEFSKRQAVLDTKRRFVRFISHEIRTPLNTMKLGLKLFEVELEDLLFKLKHIAPADVPSVVKKAITSWQQLTEDILENSESAVEVLDDLLNYDKIEMGTLKLEFSMFNIWESVWKTTSIMQIQAQQKNITLEIIGEHESLPRILEDIERSERMITHTSMRRSALSVQPIAPIVVRKKGTGSRVTSTDDAALNLFTSPPPESINLDDERERAGVTRVRSGSGSDRVVGSVTSPRVSIMEGVASLFSPNLLTTSSNSDRLDVGGHAGGARGNVMAASDDTRVHYTNGSLAYSCASESADMLERAEQGFGTNGPLMSPTSKSGYGNSYKRRMYATGSGGSANHINTPDQFMDDRSGALAIGDIVRIGQVMRNLISNALKFTPNGGLVTVSVRSIPDGLPADLIPAPVKAASPLFTSNPRAGSISIAVKDSGAGLTEQQLADICQEGVQFNANELQAGQGSGLGLFISKGIVEQHGGRLTVASEGLGKGVTFTIELPLYRQQEVSRQSSQMPLRADSLLVSTWKAFALSQMNSGKTETQVLPANPATASVLTPAELLLQSALVVEEHRRHSHSHQDPQLAVPFLSSQLQSPSQQNLHKPPTPLSRTNSEIKTFTEHFPASTNMAAAGQMLAGGHIVRRLLVVDDSHFNRKMLIRLLTSKGYVCEQAEDGSQALVKYEEMRIAGMRIEAILMDFEMPIMNGPTATKKLRELGCASLIVGVTGNVLPDDVNYFKKCGANCVLPKPLIVEDFEFVMYNQTIRQRYSGDGSAVMNSGRMPTYSGSAEGHLSPTGGGAGAAAESPYQVMSVDSSRKNSLKGGGNLMTKPAVLPPINNTHPLSLPKVHPGGAEEVHHMPDQPQQQQQ